MGFLLALSCALILYGTLYPFSFSFGAQEKSVLSLLTASAHSYVSRGDTIANVILFLPFGFFAMQRVLSRVPRPIRLIFVVIAGAAFSIGIECAQSRLPGRAVSIYDIAANTAGALFGAVMGWKDWRGKLSKLQIDSRRPAMFPLMLLGAWLGSLLLPFVPTLDVHNIKNALKPLFFEGFSPLDALRSFIVTMVACRLILTLARSGRFRTALAFLPLGVVAVKPFIIGGRVSRAEIAGTLLGIAVWLYMQARTFSGDSAAARGRHSLHDISGLGRMRLNTGILAFLLMAQIVIQELTPFVFNSSPGFFSFIPFGDFLKRITVGNILQFAERIFLYGALLWLLVKTGMNLRFSLIFSVVFLTGIEITQMFMAGHVSDITNPLLAVILGLFLYFLDIRDEGG